MRNLYQRLKPEHRLNLDKVKENYPNTYEDIVRELTKTAFYTQLTIGLVGSLCSHLGITFTLSNFINLFDEE